MISVEFKNCWVEHLIHFNQNQLKKMTKLIRKDPIGDLIFASVAQVESFRNLLIYKFILQFIYF